MQVSRSRLSLLLGTLVWVTACPSSPDPAEDSLGAPGPSTQTGLGAERDTLAADTTGPAQADAASDSSTTGPAEESSGDDGSEDETTGTTGEVEEPWARTEAPEGYGELSYPMPAPSADELTLHGLAGYEVVVVYAEPKMDSKKLGFLRFGQRLKTTPKISKEGCRKGWYALEGGGFGCASKGIVVQNKPPYMHKPPPPPRMDSASPYDWAYVRKWNAPMWWRVPSGEEYERAERLREGRESERTGTPAPGAPAAPSQAPAPAGEAKATDTDDAAASPPKKLATVADGSTKKQATLPGPTDPPRVDAAKKTANAETGTDRKTDAPTDAAPDTSTDTAADTPTDPAVDTAVDKAAVGAANKEDAPKTAPVESSDAPKDPGAGGSTTDADLPPPNADDPQDTPEEVVEELAPLPLARQHPWLEKGFFVSLAESVDEGARSYWYTARGAYVETTDVAKYAAKDFKGVELPEGRGFPVGFVMKRGGTKLWDMDDDGKLRSRKVLEKRTFVELVEEAEVNGRTYMVTTDGQFVRKSHLRLPTLQPVPEGLEAYDRWIDVSLKDQILVAYQGSVPVYVTLVSTGRKGSEEEPFDTPTGRWRIRSKMVTSNMDGTTGTDGNYAIQDVPWVMYFEGSYALHGAFWHRSFGHVRSHGCVNLGPSDARWLFNWTTPNLPAGWHGVHSSLESPGTTVVIRQ